MKLNGKNIWIIQILFVYLLYTKTKKIIMSKKKESPGCLTAIIVLVTVLYVCGEILEISSGNYDEAELEQISNDAYESLYGKEDTIPFKNKK